MIVGLGDVHWHQQRLEWKKSPSWILQFQLQMLHCSSGVAWQGALFGIDIVYDFMT